MISKFFKDASVFALISFGEKGVVLITFPLLVSRLDPTQYGLFDLTNFAVSLTVLLAGLELYQATLRYLPAAGSCGEKRRILSTILITVLSLSFVTAFLAAVTVPWVASWIYGKSGYDSLLYWGIGLVLTTSLASVAQIAARALLRTKLLVIAALLRLSIQTIVVLSLVFGAGWKADALIAAQIAGSLILSTCCLIGCRDLLGMVWDSKVFRRLLSFSGPLVVSSACALLCQQSDRAVVRALIGVESVGILGAGYRVASLVGVITSGVMMALAPLIYQSMGLPETSANLSKILRYYLMACLFLTVGLVIFSQSLVVRFTPPEYHSAAFIVPILGSVLMLSQIATFFPGLAIAGKSGILASAQIAGLAVNVAGMYLLGSAFGLVGICLSGIFAQVSVIFITGVLGQHHYPISVPWKAVLAFLIVPLAVSLAWNNGLAHTLWSVIFIFGVCAAVVLAAGMMPYNEMCSLIYKFKGRLRENPH